MFDIPYNSWDLSGAYNALMQGGKGLFNFSK